MNSNLFPNYDAVQKKSRAVVTVIIALMMASAAVSYTQMLERIFLGWQAGILPIFCGLLSLEAFYAHSNAENRTPRERLIFHVAEWVTILILLKVLVYITGGAKSLVDDLGAWENNFLSFFMEAHYMLALFPVIGIWVISTVFAHDLDQLQLDADEVYLENHEMVERDRREIRQRMVQIIMMIGMGILLLSVAVRADLGTFGDALQLGVAMQVPVINVVVYFLLMLMFLSQTQFDFLRGSWMWSGVAVSLRMGWAWVKYGLIFFALASLVAYMLPTSYTVGFLDVLRIALGFISNVILGLYTLVLLPFVALLNWLMGLFGNQPRPDMNPPAQIPPMVPENPTPGAPVPWLEVLKSLLFWTVFIGGTGYFLLYYLRQNRGLWDSLMRIQLFRWFGDWFSGLLSWIRAANVRVAEAIKAGRERLFPQAAARAAGLLRPSINFRKLDSRQKVIFFYLNLVQRGGQRGVTRRSSQTPAEYTRNLTDNFPEVKEELEGMTDAFIEARYTLHEIQAEHASRVQLFWRKVMEALKQIRAER